MTYSVQALPAQTILQQNGVDFLSVGPAGNVSLRTNGNMVDVTTLVNNTAIGVGQTWQQAETTNTGATFTDGTAKFRQAGVTYTNATSKSIMVAVFSSAATSGSTTQIIFTVNDVSMTFGMNTNSGGGVGEAAQILVPAGATYRVNTVSANAWWELR